MTHAGAAKAHWLDAWHVNPSLNKDYDVIDGLRGLAILMVLACHFIYVNPNAGTLTQLAGGFFSGGMHGVTLFFTLSGFLIAHPFWKRKIRGADSVVPRGYGWRRFWKIYPPLALSILLLVPVYYAQTGDAAYFKTAGQWLVGWPLVQPVSSRINPVMWSLIVEVHFYVVLPLLFLALKKVAARKAVWILFFVFLVIPTGYRWWNLSQGIASQLHPEIKMHFPAVLDAFAFGVLLAGLENLQGIKKQWAWLGNAGVVLMVFAMAVAAWLTVFSGKTQAVQYEIAGWLVKAAAALMLFYIADPTSRGARLFSAPWLRWCGLISYEWYLFHQPLALWTRDWMGPAQGDVVKYGLILSLPFLASLLIAAVVYRWFSLPILKFGRNRNVAI